MTTIRVWFTKTGEASYISLLDLQRVMQRALKRSGLPVWYTLGFNPHIYMTFAAPLSLGQESLQVRGGGVRLGRRGSGAFCVPAPGR